MNKKLLAIILSFVTIASLLLAAPQVNASPFQEPDDGYTVALLHMNGADASTTFTDETGKTWTANGNAQIDTAQSVFGGASGLFDGSGDFVDTADSADLDVGSGNSTIDFWVRLNATGTRQIVTGQIASSGADSTASFVVEITSANKPSCSIISSSTYYTTSAGATTMSSGTWYHVACVRDGNTLRMFLDGTQQGTVNVTGITANNVSSKLSIGRWGEYNGFYLNGWVDEYRFSKGVARWNANFTPPSAEYAPPTPTPTPTSTNTSTPTVTFTPTVTHTPTVTNTPTSTATDTPTVTPTVTDTPVITFTPSNTATVTPTDTSTPTVTATITTTPTITLTPAGVPDWYLSGEVSYGHLAVLCVQAIVLIVVVITVAMWLSLFLVPNKRKP